MSEDQDRPAAARAAGGRRRTAFSSPGTDRVVVQIKVPPTEHARLQVLAAARGVTVQRLCVESALASDVPAATATAVDEVKSLLFEVIRLVSIDANNVNQVARVANSTGVVPQELEAVLGHLRRTLDRADAALDVVVERFS